MTHRKSVFRCLVLPLLFSVCAFASAQSLRASPPIGAVVQTWHYDPLTNTVTAQVVNGSHKNITGYNISIKETYADGHVNKHEMLFDYVGRLSLIQEMQGTADEANIRKQFGDGLFHPGETRNEVFGVQSDLKNFEAIVDVVAFADQTAEATNNEGLQRLLTHRRATVASTEAADDIIKAALADPSDADPAATAAGKLQAQIALWKAQHTTDFESGEVQGMVAELNGISARQDKRNALQRYLAKRGARVATLLPHTKLAKTGERQ